MSGRYEAAYFPHPCPDPFHEDRWCAYCEHYGDGYLVGYEAAMRDKNLTTISTEVS